ncbi:MAG: SRPBCC family protein [Bacteroidetes bacterium]|nr:SRPBCC family protein [Bacteroidota bacterium]
MSQSKITVQATIQADAKKVWNYYTLPAHITQWNFADPSWHCPSATNDMRVGGTYKARMEAKDGSFGFDFEVIYTEISEGSHFTYEFGGRKATVQFKPSGNTTEVIITFDPETENPVEMQRGGWQAILNNFKSYTESH